MKIEKKELKNLLLEELTPENLKDIIGGHEETNNPHDLVTSISSNTYEGDDPDA